MSISKASAQWEGDLKGGRGTMTPGDGTPVAFSVSTRFDGVAGSNPEEMIGAALAGCFSMALTATLEKGGLRPRNVATTAHVQLDKVGEGFKITNIALKSTVDLPGTDRATLQDIAEETARSCPVAKALAGVSITVQAGLA